VELESDSFPSGIVVVGEERMRRGQTAAWGLCIVFPSVFDTVYWMTAGV